MLQVPENAAPRRQEGRLGRRLARLLTKGAAPAGRGRPSACAVVGQGALRAGALGARCQASLRRESFCSSSVSVFMPEVARMRSSICVFSSRNARVCFMSCTRLAGSGTS